MRASRGSGRSVEPVKPGREKTRGGGLARLLCELCWTGPLSVVRQREAQV
jgi:hypothetical protein